MSAQIEPPPPPHPADTTTPTPIAEQLSPFRAPGSEATKIEQSRAVAEVLAMVEAAHRWPRDPAQAIARMENVCATLLVAERAFFEYKRGRSTVLAGTVHLLVELAGCWRNVTHGVDELARDHINRQSELMAWAWDLEANHRVEQKFTVQWQRDKSDDQGRPIPGGQQLVQQRDIYENNANMGARRVREAIRRVLPAWFVEAGEKACRRTLETGGKGAPPFEQRVADAIAKFDGIGVTIAQLARHRDGRPSNEWTPYDLAQLKIAWVSIEHREADVRDLFPSDRVTGEEIVAQHAASSPAQPAQQPLELTDSEGRAYAPDDPERPM